VPVCIGAKDVNLTKEYTMKKHQLLFAASQHATTDKSAAPNTNEQEAEDYATSYGEPAPNIFDEYEQDYQRHMEESDALGSDTERIKPAIWADALFKRPKMPVHAYLPDFIYAGALTGVFAEPKAGKSTVVWYLLNAISQGKKIFDREAVKGTVLYASEQNEACFRHQAEAVPGLPENDNLAILLVENNLFQQGSERRQISSWDEQLKFWEDRIKAIDASVFVIDTLGAYFHLPANGENDNAIMQGRLAQLRRLFLVKPNLSIVLIHHNRKGAQERKDHRQPESDRAGIVDVRGASAIVGALDHAICLAAPIGFSYERNLTFVGRYVESNGMTMTIELQKDQSYVVKKFHRPDERREAPLNRAKQVRKDQTEKLKSLLPSSEDKAKSIRQLTDETDIGHTTMKNLLRQIGAATVGTGVKGKPIRYWTNEQIGDEVAGTSEAASGVNAEDAA
jgi:AAA domain